MAQDKEEKPASTRTQAVSAFTVPVTAAWLLAVGGIIGWDARVETLLANAGGIVAALGAGVAFLTVVLSAVQDIVPMIWKQRLLFPRAKFPFPSYEAFSRDIMRKARLRVVPGISGMEALNRLRRHRARQNILWSSYYRTYAPQPAVAAFSARHVAWRELLPVLLLLIAATLVILVANVAGWLPRWPAHPGLWALLLLACVLLLVMSWIAGRRSNVGLIIVVLERARDEEARQRQAPESPPNGETGPSG